MTKPSYVVEPDDPFALEVGFTSDRFSGYISKVDNTVYISAIMSLQPGNGNFSKLIHTLLSKGYTVKIPNPFPNMQAIAAHLEFEQSYEYGEPFGMCEVWVKRGKL